MAKFVRFNPKRRRSSGGVLPSVLILVLLTVIGVAAYAKYWPSPDASKNRHLPAVLSADEFVRSGKRPSSASSSDCVIKGNISSGGRIYHLPSDQYYNRTFIDESKGERWFCTEQEARAAGWRRSFR